MAVFSPEKKGFERRLLAACWMHAATAVAFPQKSESLQGRQEKSTHQRAFFNEIHPLPRLDEIRFACERLLRNIKCLRHERQDFMGGHSAAGMAFFLQTYLSNPAKKRQEWGLKELFYKINRGFRAFLPGK